MKKYLLKTIFGSVMKQFLYIFLFIFIPITSISSQENKSRFGIEVDIIPWHFDTFSRQTPFSVSGFIGGYYEYFFCNSFSLKTTLGVHNVNYKSGSGYGVHTVGKERDWQTRLGVTVEPRYYVWDNQQMWGNLFVALPLSIETGPLKDNPYKTIFQTPIIRTIPVVGYQYYFTNHLFAEVNAGLGWRLDRYPTHCDNDFDYLLGVRFGYSF